MESGSSKKPRILEELPEHALENRFERISLLPAECGAPHGHARSWKVPGPGTAKYSIEVNIDEKKTPHFFIKGGSIDEMRNSERRFSWPQRMLGLSAKEAWAAARAKAGWGIAKDAD